MSICNNCHNLKKLTRYDSKCKLKHPITQHDNRMWISINIICPDFNQK